MNHITTWILFSIIFQTVSPAVGLFDPLTVVTAGTILSGLYTYYNKYDVETVKSSFEWAADIACRKVGYCEDCEDYWISTNLEGLEYDLKKRLYGQPIATEIVISSLRHHLKFPQSRPLILSFQGPPGTGKNFVSTKILKNMFKQGERSRYVHIFRSKIDFPIQAKAVEYQQEILKSIMKSNYQCRRSIFVFDEVEKMPNGILGVLSAVVEQPFTGNNDFRKTVFILLSNTGQDRLINETLNALETGVDREDMDSARLQKLLAEHAYNEDGGLHHTGLIKNYGISHYVPFLPLEKKHVIYCIENYVRRENQILTEELVHQTLEQLTFIGPNPHLQLAYAGCKGVTEKAGYLIEREMLRKRRKSLNY